VIALTTPYLWYTTRATGIVAMLLFTAVVALGTFGGQSRRRDLHRSLRG